MSKLNPSASAFFPQTVVFTPIPSPDKEKLEYPFSFIGDDNAFCVKDFVSGILTEDQPDPGNFPHNIVEYYWIHEGCNEEEDWMCLCRLDNGNFAFYRAGCGYTGFECTGGMKLIISKDLQRLFYEGLTEFQRTKYNSYYQGASKEPTLKEEDFSFPVPVVPDPRPAAEATRAFVRIWNDGKELILTLDHVSGLEMEELQYSIRGLTAQFLTPKPAPTRLAAPAGQLCGTKSVKPKKKFYDVNICAGPYVRGIDDYFKKRFGDPNKKWELRTGRSEFGVAHNRKWGKVECSFILY